MAPWAQPAACVPGDAPQPGDFGTRMSRITPYGSPQPPRSLRMPSASHRQEWCRALEVVEPHRVLAPRVAGEGDGGLQHALDAVGAGDGAGAHAQRDLKDHRCVAPGVKHESVELLPRPAFPRLCGGGVRSLDHRHLRIAGLGRADGELQPATAVAIRGRLHADPPEGAPAFARVEVVDRQNRVLLRGRRQGAQGRARKRGRRSS